MNILKMCRLCLKETPVPISLLEGERPQYLRDVASLEIQQGDLFPKSACISCWLNLKLAYKIRLGILNANQQLTKILALDTILEDSFLNNFSDSPESICFDNDKTSEDIPNKSINVVDNPLDITENNLGIKTEVIKIKNLDNSDFTIVIVKEDPELKNKATPEKSKCRICGDNFAESEIMDHVQQHFQQELETCNICGLKLHLRQFSEHTRALHNQHSHEVNTCVVCFATFQYKSLFFLHMEKVHSDAELDSTQTRHNYMANKVGINLRPTAWKMLTDVGKEYKCETCNKIYPTQMKLNGHLRISHSKGQCSICGKLISSSTLRFHMKLHTAEKVTCDICGNTFKNSMCLRSHKRTAHSRVSYPCEKCSKVFKTSYKRLLHTKKEHTGERNYVCKECDKAFLTQFGLNEHQRFVHLRERKWKCSYCEKGFSKKWGLQSHLRQHTGETPYTCDLCGDSFKQNVSLRTHQKSKHPADWESMIKD